MFKQENHIVFAGGGTAGHLFPGLAVAEQLSHEASDVRITFAGTGKEFECKQAIAAGFDYVALPCRPLPRRAGEALRFLTDNFAGYRTASRLMREKRVSLVVGLGGYACVAMARAAARRRTPYVLLEQNLLPGRATRWLARGAELICTAFAESREHLPAECHVQWTGNPLRADFAALPARTTTAQPRNIRRPLRLLVLGGSGGSQTLNQQVPRALYKAGAALRGWKIVHQTGEREVEATRDLYRKLGLAPAVQPFIDHIAEAMLDSDLAISRAGGTTLAELAATGLPAVLLPYPHAADDHQRKSADLFAKAGAARVLDQRDISGRLDDHLAAALTDLADNTVVREHMSKSMLRLARPQATESVARQIIELTQVGQVAASG